MKIIELIQKKNNKLDLLIAVFLVIGIFAVVNFFSYQIFYRWDLTQNKIYSISEVSKETVKNLDDIVNVKAYFSEDLPSQLLSLRQEVEDILDEYQNYSNGKLRVEFIDPKDNEDTQRELYLMGIPQLTFQAFEKDKAQIVNGYMGIAISFGDKTEVIPAIKSSTQDLEYQITTAIKKVVSKETATIGFLTSNGSTNIENINYAYGELQDLYSVREVNFENDVEIPPDIDTLIIIGPTEEFSEEQFESINSFLARGGALFVLMDGVTVGNGLLAQKNNTNLDELFNKYGIKFNKDLVADARSGIASFNQGFLTFSTNYPFWPKITNDGFNQDNSAVSDLENIILPWASSLEVDESKISKEGYAYLAFTSDQASSAKDNFDIMPGNVNIPNENKKFNLALMINGSLKNVYSEEDNSFNGRIIIVGDSDFILDSFLQNTPDNLTFFQNLVDILSLDGDLIKIRSKGVSSRPIKEDLSDRSKMFMRYFNVFGITALVVIFGMSRYYLRRRSRFIDEL